MSGFKHLQDGIEYKYEHVLFARIMKDVESHMKMDYTFSPKQGATTAPK